MGAGQPRGAVTFYPSLRRATLFVDVACRPWLRAERAVAKADVAQLAEHVLGKDEVTGSIPVIGSRDLMTVG